MGEIIFRPLRADEIECRVGRVKKDGSAVSILLYKDSRCDMKLLDETVGSENWQRRHYERKGTMFCSVGIRCQETWVWKDDAGSESNVEKEKGEASDSFKRACTNWGIGRELYTAPDIWINLLESEDSKYVRFSVREIGYDEDQRISSLILVDRNGNERYCFGVGRKPAKSAEQPKSLEELAASKGVKAKSEDPDGPILCRECGDPISPKKIKGKPATAWEVAQATGGLCADCFEEALKYAAG